MSDLDVLVIGAGPAGSLAAIAAVRGGACVTLVDRAHLPRAKVCGSCLSDAGMAVLRDSGLLDAVADGVPLRTLALQGGGRAVRVAREAGVAIGRHELDARLAAHARAAGVDVRFGTSATARSDGTWEIGGASVRARCAVVADGLGGRALEALPAFEWTVSPASRMGFGALLPAGAIHCAPGEVCMHVEPTGYVGAVVLPGGAIDVAAAADPRAVRTMGGPAAYALHALRDRVLAPAAFTEADWRGTPALTRRRRALAAPGLLLAGDASGYVEPFTGEGMGWALATGVASGSLAARIAQGQGTHDEWPAIHAALVRSARARCRAIALALRWPRAVHAALALGSSVPWLAQRVATHVGRAPGAPARTTANGNLLGSTP